jgi:hypothetical protein
VVDIKKNIHISLWAKHRYQERKNIFSLNWIFYEYSKSKLLASLNQSIGPVYGNLAYDEDPHLHCLEPTQHRWVLDPNYIKAQVVMVGKATWLPPWSYLVRLQNHHLATRESTPLHPGNDPFVLCKPTSLMLWIEWLELALTNHPNPTLNQPEIEWNPLPTLHEGSGG